MNISIKNLKLKFPGANSRLFSNLDIAIANKEKVLILGPSGCGKSTLLNVLGGLIPKVIQVPMKADTLNVATNGAFVFQDPDSQFTMPNVDEELAFILENQQIPRTEMDDKIRTVLKKVNLDVKINQSIESLSGGMKQKLAIACALLQQSNTLLLDEPSSMLDTEASHHLWSTIQNVWNDKTVIIVEHRVELIWEMVDRVILMDDTGTIIKTDTPQNILRDYRDLLDQFGVWHPLSWENRPHLKILNTPSETPILSVKNLNVKRGGNHIVSVNELNIYSHEWISLEGINGSGKTSLLLAIMKLIKADGHITYNGKKIKSVKDYNGKLYPVFQNPELQFMTHQVFEEVYINLEMHYDKLVAKEETERILSHLKLLKLKDLHPLEISTGQKRRLSVATAVGGVPNIIILDEPTFGLDQSNTYYLLEMMHDLVESGTTIIMITHDENIKNYYPTRRLIIDNQVLRSIEQ